MLTISCGVSVSVEEASWGPVVATGAMEDESKERRAELEIDFEPLCRSSCKSRSSTQTLTLLLATPHYRSHVGPGRICAPLEGQSHNSRACEGQGKAATSLGSDSSHPDGAQGYQVSDDEIHMDLASFRSHYANQTGVVECVWICACLRTDCVWY